MSEANPICTPITGPNPVFIRLCRWGLDGKFAWVRDDGELMSRIYDTKEEAQKDDTVKLTEQEREDIRSGRIISPIKI